MASAHKAHGDEAFSGVYVKVKEGWEKSVECPCTLSVLLENKWNLE